MVNPGELQHLKGKKKGPTEDNECPKRKCSLQRGSLAQLMFWKVCKSGFAPGALSSA